MITRTRDPFGGTAHRSCGRTAGRRRAESTIIAGTAEPTGPAPGTP